MTYACRYCPMVFGGPVSRQEHEIWHQEARGRMTKDWMQEASNEITAQQIEQGRLTRVNVPAIIAKHCPMKEGEAWMKVPRCETCVHWTLTQDRSTVGDCEVIYHSDRIQVGTKMVDLKTPLVTVAAFGCIQWKEKP